MPINRSLPDMIVWTLLTTPSPESSFVLRPPDLSAVTSAYTHSQRDITCGGAEERIQLLHAQSQLLLMFALGVVSVLPRASVAQHLRGLADILCRSLEELGPGETLVTVPCTQSVGIILESGVFGHRAECNQGAAKCVTLNVVRRPMVFLGLEVLSDCVGEVGVVLLGATHVACSC